LFWWYYNRQFWFKIQLRFLLTLENNFLNLGQKFVRILLIKGGDKVKKLLFLSIIFLLPVLLFGQQTLWFDGTFEEAKSKAKIENKQILIFLSSGLG